jgi:hypothetical protein
VIEWIKSIFKRKTILDELSIVLVDKIGCGWYNLHSSDGVLYEFQYDEDSIVNIYRDRDIIFTSDIYSESFSLYILIKSMPRITK